MYVCIIKYYNLTIIELAYVCMLPFPRRFAPQAPNFQELIYDHTNEI